MRCCICSGYMEKERVILTNPRTHFVCPNCASELSRIWWNGGKKRRCPLCRVSLLDNYFSKPYTYNMSKSDATSVLVWVPTGTYINKNYEQDLINSLTEGNLFKAFSAEFMLTHLPNDMDLSLCNEWEEYYYQRVRNITYSSCKICLS